MAGVVRSAVALCVLAIAVYARLQGGSGDEADYGFTEAQFKHAEIEETREHLKAWCAETACPSFMGCVQQKAAAGRGTFEENLFACVDSEGLSPDAKSLAEFDVVQFMDEGGKGLAEACHKHCVSVGCVECALKARAQAPSLDLESELVSRSQAGAQPTEFSESLESKRTHC